MTKYKQIYQEMLEQNKELFESFREIHDKYALDPKHWQHKFNEKGGVVLDVVRRYENRLCHHSEGSGYGQYTTSLAEKFQTEVRNHFPKIDSVGLEPEVFTLKKINLS
ncbi:MAG: hypothetical protein Q8Q15_01165 [bacterium]|nr:hypothetical protein [bacterium]